MMFRFLAAPIFFLVVLASAYGDEPIGMNDARLKRLHAVLERLHTVLEHPSFPSPAQDGIQIWKQGTVVKFDLDKAPVDSRTGDRVRWISPVEIPLNTIVRFCGGMALTNAFENVVRISNDARSIRFVDLNHPDNHTFIRNVVVKRGDVVAFLRTENAR